MQLLYGFLFLLSGLGIFLYGIHNISIGMESVANQQLRNNIHKLAKNPLRSFGTGLVTTLIVENSSVSTVLMVGLLNAGLITLYQTFGMILGANVGSTLVLILFCFDSFNLVDFLAISVFVGAMIMLFANSDKSLRIGKTIAGFGMLFCGLKIMSLGMTDVMAIEGANEFVAGLTSVPVLFIIGIFFGMTFHVLGTTALMISLINLPSSPFTLVSALVIILGANIGSTVSAILASLKSNIHSKRAAIFNVILNVFGSFFMLMIIFVTPWLDWMQSILPQLSFMIVFTIIALNLFSAFVFIWLLKPLEKFMIKIVKEKKKKDSAENIFLITEAECRNVIVVKHNILKGVYAIIQSVTHIFKLVQKELLLAESNPRRYKNIGKEILQTKTNIQDTINNILRVNGAVDKDTYDRLNAYNSAMLESETLLQIAEKLIITDKGINPEQQNFLDYEKSLIDEIFETINKLFDGAQAILTNEISGEEIKDLQTEVLLNIEDEFAHLKTKVKKTLLTDVTKQKNKSVYENLFVVFSQLERACDHLTNLIIKLI